MRAIDNYLYIRGRYYYYRRALPTNLSPILPAKEICIALGTQDLTLARLYKAKIDIEIQNSLGKGYEGLESVMTVEGLRSVSELLSYELEQLREKAGLPQKQVTQPPKVGPFNKL